jgi:hypothetical protein
LAANLKRRRADSRDGSVVGPLVCLALDYHETFNISMKNFNNISKSGEICKDMLALDLPRRAVLAKIEGRRKPGERSIYG